MFDWDYGTTVNGKLLTNSCREHVSDLAQLPVFCTVTDYATASGILESLDEERCCFPLEISHNDL